MVERSSLIKHSSHKINQEDAQRMQNAERSSTNSDNQAFLNDVSIRKGHLNCRITILFIFKFSDEYLAGGDASVGRRRSWLAQIEQIEEANGGWKL